MKQLKAVFFDLDGVVVDSMRIHADSWIAILAEQGIEITPDEIFRREGMSGIGSIIDIFRERGLSVPDDGTLAGMLERKLIMFENHTIGLFPGVADILLLIRDHGLSMALVTGSLRRTVEFELDLEIRSFFDAIITIEDVERGKPDPDPYLKAARVIGVAPGEALVIENAPMGVISAKRAGIFCVAVQTTLGREHLAAADIVVQNHRELLDYLSGRLETMHPIG